MKRRFNAWMLPLAGSCALAVAACGEEEPPVPPRPSATATVVVTAPAASRTVTDMTGRTVALGETIRRVVVLSSSAADYAAALGLNVVGRTSDVDESAAPGSTVAGSTLSPDFNAVARLAPDLVIADAAVHGSRTPDFDRFGLPVFVLKAADYNAILDALTVLGQATGREAQAAAASEAIKARVLAASLDARTKAAGSPPRVLILTGGGLDVFAAGSNTYAGNLLSILGAENVLGATPEGGPLPGFGVVEVAQAAELAPDVVIVLPSGAGGITETILAAPEWAGTPAIRNGAIRTLDTGLFLRSPGPRIAEAVETLADALWP